LLKEDLLLLVSLQKIDTELVKAGIKKREWPNRISQLDETFGTTADEVDGEKQRLEGLIKTHRAKEEGLKKGVDHLKKTRERLLEVKTNKEYQAMLKEIEGIVKKNSEIEDEIILALEEIDAARSRLKVKEGEFETFRSSYEKEKKELEGEIGLMDSEMSRLVSEQQELRARINAEILKKYDRIKNHSNGRAVVPVWKGVCEACHMNIPPQMYNELQRSDDIMQCPFCSRIIFWDDRGKHV
jgi:predicted  nucleic acid-binding Zn-ribbon protein